MADSGRQLTHMCVKCTAFSMKIDDKLHLKQKVYRVKCHCKIPCTLYTNVTYVKCQQKLHVHSTCISRGGQQNGKKNYILWNHQSVPRETYIVNERYKVFPLETKIKLLERIESLDVTMELHLFSTGTCNLENHVVTIVETTWQW